MHSLGRGHVCGRARAVHNLFNSGGASGKGLSKTGTQSRNMKSEHEKANESDSGGKRAVEGKPVRSCGCGRASFWLAKTTR